MKKSKKFIFSVIIVAFILAVIGNLHSEISEDMEIYDKTLRIHIPANSDSDEDQALKLQVRDAIIEIMKEPLSDCKNKEDAVKVTENMKNKIKETAERVIEQNGKNYSASVTLTEEYYPKKEYEGITLPAGTYTSLKIELGEAEGKNWWCVLFPQVCTGTAEAKETLAQVGFTTNQIRLLTDQESGEYVIKFKIIEIVKSIFG